MSDFVNSADDNRTINNVMRHEFGDTQRIKFKKVMRYSKNDGLFRLFRVIWMRGKGAGYGYPDNYHGVFKLALSRKMFSIKWKYDDYCATLFFIRFTFEKCFGGIPV